MRRTLGSIAAIVTVMSLIGVAWATDDVGPGAGDAVDPNAGATSTSITTADEATSVSAGGEDSTSTRIDDDETTATSVAGVTSDSLDDSTATTVADDHDDDEEESATSTTLDGEEDDDDAAHTTAALGVHTYAVSGVGGVTIEVLANGLSLVGVDAPGWTMKVEKVESDRIEIEFRRGDSEAEFEAELHSDAGLSIEIDSD